MFSYAICLNKMVYKTARDDKILLAHALRILAMISCRDKNNTWMDNNILFIQYLTYAHTIQRYIKLCYDRVYGLISLDDNKIYGQ